MNMDPKRLGFHPHDLAGIQHWNSIYGSVAPLSQTSNWTPQSHDQRALAYALQRAIGTRRVQSILEVGCGNSVWLSYLARLTGAQVVGLDYSPNGCELARHQLASQGIPGRVVCGDLFKATVDEIGQFDLVFSLGLVEHFDNLDAVLTALARFVRPGGILFTEVPNLSSFHGLLARIWHPELLAKHQIVTRRHLAETYPRIGFKAVQSGYAGRFSLDIVAWELYPRWPRLAPKVTPRVRRLQKHVERLMARVRNFEGSRVFAPYIYVFGVKEDCK